MRANVQPEPSVERSAVEYNARSIQVLRGVEAVRANPSMYVGSTDESGLRQVLFELIYNALDEASSGYCRNIRVRAHADGSWSVEDDGRGIPTDIHPTAGVSACELVLTTLHAGSKFSRTVYGLSAGMHGVGLSCVNALSAWLTVDVHREGRHFVQRYEEGQAQAPLTSIGSSDRTGTVIRFFPDAKIFRAAVIDADAVKSRMEELAFLLPGLRLEFVDDASGEELAFHHSGGIREFAALLNRRLRAFGDALEIEGQTATLRARIVLQWTDGYAEQLRTFVNRVSTPQGGTHVDGLRTGVSLAIREHAVEIGLLHAEAADDLTSYDIWEGLTAVMSLEMEQPRFDGQIKNRLSNDSAFQDIVDIATAQLRQHLGRNPRLGRLIAERAVAASRVRTAARRARDAVRVELTESVISEEIYKRQFGIRSQNWHESCTWLTDAGLLQRHADLFEVAKGSRLLDVCCGSGVVGAAFDGLAGEKVGLDLTPEMVNLASQRLDKVVEGNVYHLPFQDGEFDIVVNREVLHLLPHCGKALSEISRVLRPGGQFIVGQIVPFSEVDAYWMYRIFKKKQPLLYNMFLESEFRGLLTAAGFVDLKMTEYLLWESIDLWIDTHETVPLHRHEIRNLFYEAPREVRAVHPFSVEANGEIRDCWRWCVYSVRKP